MEELRRMGERYNVKVMIETFLSVPALPSAGSCSYETAANKKKGLSEGLALNIIVTVFECTEQPQSSVGDCPPPPSPPPTDPPTEDNMCPYCRQSPCIIITPPNWLRGSAQACLSNQAKRYRLYKKFWTLMGRLGLWNDPHYIALKATRTLVTDKRDVLPLCVITVSRTKYDL